MTDDLRPVHMFGKHFTCRQLAPHIREKHSATFRVLYGRRRTGTGNVCVAMKTEEFERKRGSLPTMPHTLRVDVQFLG